MATSRTGTGKYLRNRQRVIQQAKANDLTNCPACGTTLNYAEPRLPNSAETDHIIPHSRGGSDDLDNLTVICRWCNLRKGGGRKRKPATPKRIDGQPRTEW